MRKKLIEADVIECVLGLGPLLFYNSPMEACVVARERAQSFLTDDHIARVVAAYRDFVDAPGFARGRAGPARRRGMP